MNETSRNFLVGVFVVVSLVVLAVLLAWFGEAPNWLGGNEWTLRIVGVRQLHGLEAGSPVKLNGVEIGRVRYLDFADRSRPDSGVVVFAGIRDEFVVPGEAHARVYGATLGFGTGHVDIVVPAGASPEPLPQSDSPMIEGVMHDALAEIIPRDLVGSVQGAFENLSKFAEAATPAAQALGEMLAPPKAAPGEGVTANLASAIQKFDSLISNLDEVVGDPTVQDDFRTIVSEIRGGVTDLRAAVETLRSSTERLSQSVEAGVGEVRGDFDQAFANLNTVLERLDDSASSLARTMQHIEEGKGTLGMLAKDPRLYEAAVLSLQRFADAMTSLKVILARIENEGYIPVGSRSGLIRKDIPVTELAGPK